MEALVVAKTVFVKQTIEWAEMITGYETANRYQVYFKNHGDPNYTMLFTCKEMSEFCERNYCSSDTRPFTMNLKHMTNNNDDNTHDYANKNFAVLKKPFKCTYYCFNRPKMYGYFNNLEGPEFGRIYQPYKFTDPIFQLIRKDIVIYSVTTDCCKCGFCCRGGCGMFEQISFLIYDGDINDRKNKYKEKGSTGKILRHSMGVESIVSDADNFEVFFPPEAGPEDKLLLISVALMIDYMFFEEMPK